MTRGNGRRLRYAVLDIAVLSILYFIGYTRGENAGLNRAHELHEADRKFYAKSVDFLMDSASWQNDLLARFRTVADDWGLFKQPEEAEETPYENPGSPDGGSE